MLIAGGRLVDPAQRLDAVRDVRIRDGVIAEIGEHLTPDSSEEVFDARGAYVAPGFIDMHVHLREPGNPEKETLETGSAAAVAGGFTAVAAMPNTNPAIDTPQLVAWLAGAPARCRIYPVAAITKARQGAEILDYASLAAAGARAFSDDGSTVMNAAIVREAARAAAGVPGAFIVHCEDEDLKRGTVMTEGEASRQLGVRGCPPLAEDVIVARDVLIAQESGKPWHIAHLSTEHALQIVLAARHAGIAVTSEVTPHHLVFTDETVLEKGSAAKVNPPLRSQADVEALRRAVRDGQVDAFATDHAPHTEQEKSAELSSAAVGFTGLEIALGAYAFALPGLPVLRFVELLSTNPARILGVPGGSLAPGSVADVTVFADRAWRVDPKAFYSKGHSTPFAGMTLPRRAIATVIGGDLVMRDGRLIEAGVGGRPA